MEKILKITKKKNLDFQLKSSASHWIPIKNPRFFIFSNFIVSNFQWVLD
jgi:hypothetical protein